MPIISIGLGVITLQGPIWKSIQWLDKEGMDAIESVGASHLLSMTVCDFKMLAVAHKIRDAGQSYYMHLVAWQSALGCS